MRLVPILLAVVLAQAERPDLAGTWRLDESRSEVAVEAPYAGLIGVGAPRTLHVTQPANGTLVVESQVNESHSRLYVPGRETSTPIFLGEAGSIAMTARWEERRLAAEGERVASAGGESVAVRESLGLTADGETLVLEIVVSGPEGEHTTTARYSRIESVGPCETWPSPCKDDPNAPRERR